MQIFLNGSTVQADMQDTLSRAVVISIFTWRRADNGDVFDGTNLQGWWGDTYSKNNDKIGSKLWQLLREKITDDSIAEVESVVRESLQWLLDEGICVSVDVTVQKNGNDRLNILVQLETKKGLINKYRFEDVA